jgi:hypothetical protein
MIINYWENGWNNHLLMDELTDDLYLLGELIE